MSELWVVSVARQVEMASREGHRAETRRDIFERLATTFLRDVRYANAVTSRAALGLVIARALEGEASLSKLQRRDSAWEQVVDSIDDAIGTLRVLGVDAKTLTKMERDEPLARVLRKALDALDERLARAGLIDERRRRAQLGEALTHASPEDVVRAVGAPSLRARFLLRWEADAAWWKPLAMMLRRVGGDAVVELPTVPKPIDASRATDPFETVVSDVARALDEAPVEVALASVFGDLTLTSTVPSAARERVEIRRALDAEAQARAAVFEVARALDQGISIDRVALAVPRGASPTARAALERLFEEAAISLDFGGSEEVRGALADVAFSLMTVGASGLPRRDVAALLRSRSLDATTISGVSEVRAAHAALHDLATTLDQTSSAEVDDPLERLVATAVARRADPSHRNEQRGAIARRFGHVLMVFTEPGTRAGRARAARTLFAQVGLHAGAGGAVSAALARDEPASSLTRCEIDAYARDARAIAAIATALDDIERGSVALGDDEPCSIETFVHELRMALLIRRPTSAARVGAVRAERIEDLLFNTLDLVVVVDANAGVLPTYAGRGDLVTPEIEEALAHRDIRRANAPARDLVELAVTMEHVREIVICYRAADDDGAALAASPLVSWLERGGVTTATVHGTPTIGAPTTPHERTLALVAVAPERASQIAPYAARVAIREAAREAFHSGASSGGASIRDAPELHALLEVETGGGARPLSVTAVERMARCAFQGFAAQVLGALDDDPRTDDVPGRREEGILTHEALAAAFTAAAPLFRERPRDRKAIERAASVAADAVLALGGRAIVRASLDRISLEVANIVALAVTDEDWDFAVAEQGFGDTTTWPAFVVESATTRVALRGRIDRIDIARGVSAVRAIDYKRRVSLPPTTDLGGAAIQVPIYALVARRALGATEARGRYLSTVSPARSSTTTFDARFAELVEPSADGSTEASRFVVEIVRALRAGEIEPRPSAAKWCAQCGLDGACRRPRFAGTSADDA